MVLRRRIDPTCAVDLAEFWLPLLDEAPGVPLADLDDARPPSRAHGAYIWYRRGSDGDVEQVLYAGSGHVRNWINRERKKILEAEELDRDGIEVAHVITGGREIARLVELLAIERLTPAWQRSGFGSNAPGSGRAGQRPAPWDTEYQRG